MIAICELPNAATSCLSLVPQVEVIGGPARDEKVKERVNQDFTMCIQKSLSIYKGSKRSLTFNPNEVINCICIAQLDQQTR